MSGIINLAALGSGLVTVWAFMLLPWLVVSTPVIDIGHQEISGIALSTIGAWLTGGALGTMWILPIAGLLMTLSSAIGVGAKGGAQKTVGAMQAVASLSMTLPLALLWFFYGNFIEALNHIVSMPGLLSVEGFLNLGQGFHYTLLAAIIGLAAGIINVKGA